MIRNNGSEATSDAGMDALGAGLGEHSHVHPAWAAFIRFCSKLQHGDIERLRIQDGLPVLAEVAIKKVKFT